jgi:TolB-like protein
MIRPKREGRAVVGFSDFVAELKRRRVIRTLLGWGIASFAVLQVYEPVMHGLHLPEWTLSFVVVILGLGFPVTAALAWTFDLKASGIERTRPLANGELPTVSRSRGARLALPLGLGLAAAAPGFVYFFVWPGAALHAPNAQASTAVPAGPSIGVLPFADMSATHDQEYLADGIAEEILNALAGMDGLRVSGRTSSFFFKGKAAEPAEIGRKLGVATLLEGSVRKEGNRVRVTAQLVNAADGFRLWSETFDQELGGIFQVQDEIARAVVAGLQPRLLGSDTSQLRAVKPTRWEAYSLYLRGRRLLARESWLTSNGEETARGAREAFERAILLDPGFAPAHAGLAEALDAEASWVAETPGDVTRFANLELAAAQRAIDLDPTLAEGYVARSAYRLAYAWDWKGGLADAERALALRPGDMRVAIAQSRARLAFNRKAEAVEAARRATELDPLSPAAWAELAHALGVSGASAAGEAPARKCEELSPGNCCVHLAWSLMGQGRTEAAAKQFSSCQGSLIRLEGLAITSHRMGREAEALAALDELVRQGALGYAFGIAEVFAVRGELDQAFHWLERARIQHDPLLEHVGHSPSFGPLKGDARWAAFLRKMEIPAE